MQLYLLFLPEYIEEIGSTFPLRKSFRKVWIELNILPQPPVPINLGVGTQLRPP